MNRNVRLFWFMIMMRCGQNLDSRRFEMFNKNKNVRLYGFIKAILSKKRFSNNTSDENTKFLLIMLVSFSKGLSAEIYQWVDSSGKVHYSDSLGSGQNVEKLTIEIKSNDLNGVIGSGTP